MRLYIIGKLMSNKKVIAYKIYDSDTKESKLIATKDIMKAPESFEYNNWSLSEVK